MHTYPLVRPSDLSAQANGRLGANLLELTEGGDSLHHTAARAFDAMHAHAARMGVTLTMTDGYRPLAIQERLFTERYLRTYNPLKTTTQSKVWDGQRWWKRRGVATAAVPGTSNHGWGLAADITDASGARLRWLEEFAADYGFSWELLPEEPWHIRYVTGDRIPAAALAYETAATPAAVTDQEDDGMYFVKTVNLDGSFAIWQVYRHEASGLLVKRHVPGIEWGVLRHRYEAQLVEVPNAELDPIAVAPGL